MHICIVGTGAAGWMACNFFKNYVGVEKVTIIGSSKIPSIGVGESTTLVMSNLILNLISNGEFTEEEFIAGTNAAIKYGVMYRGWSDKEFIHYFKTQSEFSVESDNFSMEHYGRLLANKEKSVHIHELMGKQIYEEVKKNNLLLDQSMYEHAYHFDANMFIDFMSKNALKDKKVNLIDDKVMGGNKVGDAINGIYTENNGTIEADFYIFGTGDYKINEEFLGIQYKSMSDILLTNKAIAYPLPYKNKKEEFHPYTIAKTMKNGWRWITPTWSRIGTGYVFSDRHISVDNAIEEFRNDIGDSTIEPFVVDFSPKKNPQEIHENWCTIGMASGFLEPLDAPGLNLTGLSIMYQIPYYIDYIRYYKNLSSKEKNISEIEKINSVLEERFNFWASFILSQYKTSNRLDTEFWRDHHNVKWDFYENLINNIDNVSHLEIMMIQQTMSGKDVNWKTRLSSQPYKTMETQFRPVNHFEYIKSARDKVENYS